MVVSESGPVGSKILKSRYPVTEGLVAGTTKVHGQEDNLVPQEGDLVLERDKKLL